MNLPAPRADAPWVSVLMYHQVGPYPRPDTHRALFCHVDRFRSQMAYLQRFGYRVLSLQQACDGLFGGVALPARSVVLTFDDGFADFAEFAWPVLRSHGFPASVFLVSDLIGTQSGWNSDGALRSPLMDAPTLRRLQAEGVDFGSHSRRHRRLHELAPDALRDEVTGSKHALEDLLGRSVPHFCYPYGAYDERVRDVVAQAGYRSGLTCIRGAANAAANAFELPRKAISWGDNLVGYAWKLHAKHRPKVRTRTAGSPS